MKTFTLLFSLILAFSVSAQTIVLNGIVKDRITEKPVSNAFINFPDKGLTTQSDASGKFVFSFAGQTPVNPEYTTGKLAAAYVQNRGIILSIPSSGYFSLELFDIAGRIIDKKVINDMEEGRWCYRPPVSDYGIFVCRVTSNSQVLSLKFKQNGNSLSVSDRSLVQTNDGFNFDPYPSGSLMKSAFSGLNSIEASKDGYNSKSVTWNGTTHDTLEIYLLDTTARDGVLPGQWYGTTDEGNSFYLQTNGTSLTQCTIAFLSGAFYLDNPLTIPSNGELVVDSVTFYFSDSVIVGESFSRSEAIKCRDWHCTSECHFEGGIQVCTETCNCDFEDVYYGIDTTITYFKAITSRDAMLSGLVLGAGTLDKTFSGDIREYICTLNTGVTTLSIKPLTHSDNTVIHINNYYTISSNTTINLDLTTGIDTILIEVEAANRLDKVTYRIILNIPVQWYESGESSVNITDICVDPLNSSRVYACSNFGMGYTSSIVKSTDAGKNWSIVNEVFEIPGSMDYYALAINPVDPDVVYSANGDGLFKTINGGSSWTSLLDYSSSKVVAINPLSPSQVYADYFGSIYKTTTGGATWGEKLSKIEATALAISQADPEIVFAAGDAAYSHDTAGLYKTVDGGNHWKLILQRQSIRTIATNPSDTNVLYIGTAEEGIYKSSDGGDNWNAMNSGLNHLMINDIVIDPTSPQTLYAATWEGGVYKSINGGESWSQMNQSLTNTYVNCLAIDPHNPSVVYAGTQDGIFKYK